MIDRPVKQRPVALRRHPCPGLQPLHQLELDAGFVELAVAVLPADLRLMVPPCLTLRVRPKPGRVHPELAGDPADHLLGHGAGILAEPTEVTDGTQARACCGGWLARSAMVQPSAGMS